MKTDSPGHLRRAAERLASDEAAKKVELVDLLTGSVLIPIPRSSPLKQGALWPAHRICEELLRAGLGKDIVPCLERVKAVQKSAFAARGDRPDVPDHIGSLSVTTTLATSGPLVVVDDFVTRGATILAAATLVSASFPQRDVAAFALVRTMGLVSDVDRIPAPCMGRIWVSGSGVLRREP